MPAVMPGVSAVGYAILLIGSLVARQVTIVVAELPQNTQNIKAKVQKLRQFGSSQIAAQFEEIAEEISEATIVPGAEETTSSDKTNAETPPKVLRRLSPISIRMRERVDARARCSANALVI